MMDMSIDTETVATDRELVEIETKARANTVMHWPELIRTINRLRKAEAEIERLRAALDDANDTPAWDALEICRTKFRQAEAEIGRLREENEKLKAVLGRRGEIIFGTEGD